MDDGWWRAEMLYNYRLFCLLYTDYSGDIYSLIQSLQHLVSIPSSATLLDQLLPVTHPTIVLGPRPICVPVCNIWVLTICPQYRYVGILYTMYRVNMNSSPCDFCWHFSNECRFLNETFITQLVSKKTYTLAPNLDWNM